MTLTNLTHIWGEVPPLSDVSSFLPAHTQVIYRRDAAASPIESAMPAQAILASSLLQYNGELFDQLPNLRMVCRTGIGIDNLDLNDATERGIVCCHTPDGPTESTAEHTVAMLLALSKRLKQGNANLAAGQWGPRAGMLIGDQVQGKTLGLLGLGRIGRRVGQICRLGLDMRVMGYDPFVGAEDVANMGFEWMEQDQVIAQADYLSVHIPATPETYHLMNRERISQMKDGAYLLNMSRGPLVDPAALLDAMDKGKLNGAGIDVFEPEPPEVDSPLRNHPNIIATPHIAGVTVESRTLMEQMAIERILAFFRGEKPDNMVNPEVWEQLK
ncbi:MAG: NAD(P)-dependent oxidoreductase [Chloroflexota bacterium]